MNRLHDRALEYIKNTGGKVPIAHFDDDHEPIGPMLRGDMKAAGLIMEVDGYAISQANPPINWSTQVCGDCGKEQPQLFMGKLPDGRMICRDCFKNHGIMLY